MRACGSSCVLNTQCSWCSAIRTFSDAHEKASKSKNQHLMKRHDEDEPPASKDAPVIHAFYRLCLPPLAGNCKRHLGAMWPLHLEVANSYASLAGAGACHAPDPKVPFHVFGGTCAVRNLRKCGSAHICRFCRQVIGLQRSARAHHLTTHLGTSPKKRMCYHVFRRLNSECEAVRGSVVPDAPVLLSTYAL